MNFVVGQNYYVRTCLVSVDGPYTVTLTDFAWVAESGRLHEFLRDGGTANMEIEPAPPGMTLTVQWLAALSWPHALLREAR